MLPMWTKWEDRSRNLITYFFFDQRNENIPFCIWTCERNNFKKQMQLVQEYIIDELIEY